MRTLYDVGDVVLNLVTKKGHDCWGDPGSKDIIEGTKLEIEKIVITKSNISYLCAEEKYGYEAYFNESEIELVPVKVLKKLNN